MITTHSLVSMKAAAIKRALASMSQKAQNEVGDQSLLVLSRKSLGLVSTFELQENRHSAPPHAHTGMLLHTPHLLEGFDAMRDCRASAALTDA